MTTVKGQKIWQNSDLTAGWPTGATVTVGLYTRENDVDTPVTEGDVAKTAELSATKTGFTFANLPQYDANNNEIIYVVKEESVTIGETKYDVTDGKITIGSGDNAVVYTVSNGTGSNGYDITNTLAGDADVIITKTWGTVNGLVNDHFDSISIKITGTAGTGAGTVTKDYDYTITKGVGGNLTVTADQGTDSLEDTDYTATINDNGDWKIKFLKLPVANNSGVKYTYTVTETKIGGASVVDNAANGYAVSVVNIENDPLHITNTPETATLTIEKNWVGGVSENSVTFRIVGNITGVNTPVIDESVTVSKDTTTNKWETSITLPKYWKGQAITYTVGETDIPEGYEVSYKVNDTVVTATEVTWTPAGGSEQSLWGAVIDWITGQPSAVTGKTCTVIATNTLQTAGIQFTKSYSGGVLDGDTSNKTDAELAQFTLTGNSQTVTLTRTNNVYTTVDSIASGALKYGVVYTLHEIAPAGYTPMADKYLKLTKDTNGYKVVECDSNGNELTGDKAKGYAVADGVANLTPDNTFIVNNVIKGEFTFTKAFNSTIPDNAPTFTVYEATKNNNNSYTTTTIEVANAVGKSSVVEDKGWSYKISNLECGKYYAVVEDDVTNYESLTFYLSVQPDGDDTDDLPEVTVVQTLVADKENNSVWNNDNTVLTNTVKTAELILTKTYDGKDSNAVGSDVATFTIVKKGTADSTGLSVTREENEYTFTGLQCGQTYQVTETAPAGYHGVSFEIVVTDKNGTAVAETQNAVMLGPDGNKTNISVSINNNTLDNTIKTTSFSFTKEYVGPQPEADEFATFAVTADKYETYSQTVSIADGKYTLSNLKFGYTYIVKENAPEGYVPAEFTVTVDTAGNVTATSKDATGKDVVTDANGTVVTNYLEQQKLSLKGMKKWVGGTTNSAITLELFCDGVTTNRTTETTLNWEYHFDNLDRFDVTTGEPHKYTVKEVTVVDGFKAYYENKGFDKDGNIIINVTNVKDVAMMPISGIKKWFDTLDVHPEITIELYQRDTDGASKGDNVLVGSRTLNDTNGWKYDFGLWPRTDNEGNPYEYQIVEKNVPEGYVSVVLAMMYTTFQWRCTTWVIFLLPKKLSIHLQAQVSLALPCL